MKTDRELLELAAKAAGIEIATWSNCQAGGFLARECLPERRDRFWNPLTDDGDALRLAVKLDFTIDQYQTTKECSVSLCYANKTLASCFYGEIGKEAATRCAIVRAAAKVGEAMQ